MYVLNYYWENSEIYFLRCLHIYRNIYYVVSNTHATCTEDSKRKQRFDIIWFKYLSTKLHLQWLMIENNSNFLTNTSEQFYELRNSSQELCTTRSEDQERVLSGFSWIRTNFFGFFAPNLQDWFNSWNHKKPKFTELGQLNISEGVEMQTFYLCDLLYYIDINITSRIFSASVGLSI